MCKIGLFMDSSLEIRYWLKYNYQKKEIGIDR